jgi:carboxylesterase
MPYRTDLDPSPFLLEGGSVGVLLIHGFTGSPPEMRLVGDYLNQRGLAELQDRCHTVFVGGLSLGAALTLYLAAHHDDLAGALTYAPPVQITDWRVHLLPIARYLIRGFPKGEEFFADPVAESRLWSYDEYPAAAASEVLIKLNAEVIRLLPRVSCPLLIVYSTKDPSVGEKGIQLIYDQVSSTDKELVTLHESGHVLTVDSEWEVVAEKSYQFIMERVPQAA